LKPPTSFSTGLVQPPTIDFSGVQTFKKVSLSAWKLWFLGRFLLAFPLRKGEFRDLSKPGVGCVFQAFQAALGKLAAIIPRNLIWLVFDGNYPTKTWFHLSGDILHFREGGVVVFGSVLGLPRFVFQDFTTFAVCCSWSARKKSVPKHLWEEG